MIKILIADDEYTEREILLGIIQQHFDGEADVRLATNGRQAVDVATVWGADLILMDIEMPGLTGLEATKQILAQKPDCKVIFITAFSVFSYAHAAVKLGICDYLLKPVNPDEVVKSIRHAYTQLESQKQLASVATQEDSTYIDKNSALMHKVKRYLQYNYMLYDLSLDSVSKITNIAPSYLSSSFKKCFGVNFVDYVTGLRIQAAQQLLQDPLLSTSEIAGMVGYDSASYFTRAFKRHTGMTPTDYRRQGIWKKEE